MKRSTRMLLMNADRNRDIEYKRGNEYRNEDRVHERIYNSSGGYIESRFRDRSGREHYDNGRYAPMRNYHDDGAMMNHPTYPYIPPVYERGDTRDMNYRQNRPMAKIGFMAEGEIENIPEMEPNYHQTNEYNRIDEMKYGTKGNRSMGFSAGDGYSPFTKEISEAWTRGMKNDDGTHGPHWTLEQTKQVQAQRGMNGDPYTFWAVMNSLYSDYSSVAKKNNVNNVGFYADLAQAWIEDEDAEPDKAARYFQYIVKH